MKKPFPKINSVNYGGKWIAAGLIIGGAIPFVFWLVFHRVIWFLIIIGIIILAAFTVLFAIEMYQDNSPVPYYEKTLKETVKYDPEKQYPVIHCYVCTGEKIAGFKDRTDGHFTEAMLIHSPEDEERFKKIYGLDMVKTEY